jgi:NAD kinase
MLAVRPLVIAPDSEVVVETIQNPAELIVTVDGQVGTNIGTGEKLVVRTRAKSGADCSFSGDELLPAPCA